MKRFQFPLHLFAIALCLSSLSQTSARLFPNISSIPSYLVPNATIPGAWDAFKHFGNCHAGEKVDGLGKLKKYFNRFGYIPNLPTTNLTDDFDEDLEAALKTYQKNFNLNVTGELDGPTLEHLVKPRCGNPDVVNGTTTMNSGKPASYNSTKFHSVSHYSFFPSTPVWPQNRRDLTYAFLPENELSDAVKTVFVGAFQRWSAATPLTFKETTSFYSADIKIGFFVGDHGDGEPFDGVLGTLAHAFSPPSGRLHLDGDENWVITGDISKSSVKSAVDLESVAVHEIGHLLGLGHSSVEDAIMYPTISSRTKKVELASDDVLGIQTLYGANPNYDGTTTSAPSTQARDTSAAGDHLGSTSRLWALRGVLAIGFLLLLF
ncbi:metalloendoproteinase 2-MMP-like [Pyrus communis]|uniref:metalloendoproteinase 2-MMP-like n=1 Tax=Pyrus communis TaxID=23211 RepID=UPI0035C1F876